MSIALSEFWTRLVESGITDPDGCKKIAAAFCDANGGTPPSEAVSLAKFLIKNGQLSEYQAGSILEGRSLKVGRYVVIDSGPSPFARWLAAKTLDDGSNGVLFLATPEHLVGGRDQWLAAHAEVVARSLQSAVIENLGEQTTVFAPLPEGCVATPSALGKRRACEVGIAVAEAIAALHARNLVHGSVRLDRIWLGSAGETLLLRDPSGPPSSPLAQDPHGWLDPSTSPLAFCAPELAVEGAACDQASDIYALGCLIYCLATGRMPAEGSTQAELLAAHAEQTPAEIVDAVQKGETGDPLFRVLGFAVAKNPASRFATSQQFCEALQATLPLIDEAEPPVAAIIQDEPAAETVAATETSTPEPPPIAAPPAVEENAVPPKAENQKAKTKPAPPKPSLSQRKPKATQPTTPSSKAESSRPATKQPKSKKSKSKPTAPPVTKASTSSQPKNAKASTGDPQAATKPTEPAETNDAPSMSAAKERDADATAAEVTETTTNGEGETAAAPPIESPAEPPVVAASDVAITTDDASGESTGPPAANTSAASTSAASTSAASTSAASASAPARTVRRRKKKKSRAPIILGAMCVPILLMLMFLIVGGGGEEEKKPRTRPPIPDVIPSVTGRSTAQESDPVDPMPAVAGYELIEDDRLLWVPPYGTDSKSASLELLPPGPGVVMSVNLASINQSPVGDSLVDAFSPELGQLLSQVATRAKVDASEIKRCGVALHPGKDGWPDVSLAIELVSPKPLKQLTEDWDAFESKTRTGATIYAGDEEGTDAYYIAPDDKDDAGNVARFAVGSIPRVSEVAENEGGAIPLPRSLQNLWKATSIESDLAVLLTPNFLVADGRELLATSAPQLVAPMKSLLIPDVAAALLIADISDDNVFAELRLAPSGGISEAALMKRLSETVNAWPDWASGFMLDSVPDASWRLLWSRLEQMMSFVSRQARFGISDGAATANVYLPSRAASQVSVALLYALNTKPGSGSTVAATPQAKPLTMDEMLDRKMSVSFDQESLEFGINTVVDEFKRSLPGGSELPPVRIVGGDLEAGGITQNQQIRDFSKSDVPLRTVLTDLVLGANPDKTATGPSDPKQALIWVVADDPQASGGKAILITTRAAAATKQYTLPREFKVDP